MSEQLTTQEQVREAVNAQQWYHRFEIVPGVVTPGIADVATLVKYVGLPEDLTGKTVLDVGAFDGAFSFLAERRGADRVVAFDRRTSEQSSFQLARRILKSKVEFVQGNVYDLSPATVGEFDVVLFMGVLYHLRNPLAVIRNLHEICRELLIVESHVMAQGVLIDDQYQTSPEIQRLIQTVPLAQFFPGAELNNDASNWWAPTVLCLQEMLRGHGFEPKLVSQWSSRAAFHCRKSNQPLSWLVQNC